MILSGLPCAKFSQTHPSNTQTPLSSLSTRPEGRVGCTDPLLRRPRPHLGVLLGHVLLGELGELDELGDDLLDVVAVGAVHQDGGHRVQDGLVRGLEAPGRGEAGKGRENTSEQTSAPRKAPLHGPQVGLGGWSVWPEQFSSEKCQRHRGKVLAPLAQGHPQQHPGSMGGSPLSTPRALCLLEKSRPKHTFT